MITLFNTAEIGKVAVSSMRLDKRKWQIVCVLFPRILMVTLCLRQLFRAEFLDSHYNFVVQKKYLQWGEIILE